MIFSEWRSKSFRNSRPGKMLPQNPVDVEKSKMLGKCDVYERKISRCACSITMIKKL